MQKRFVFIIFDATKYVTSFLSIENDKTKQYATRRTNF